MYPKKELAQIIIAACKEYQIDTVVVSPGSRNAPLTIGFSNHPGFETLSIVDERCAAFFALGIAQQKQKPVAIVCTSGSALLNYYPAVAEAYYSQIPLVVISADRPKHLIDVGDGQTIRQENVFDNHILFNANLVEGKTDENLAKVTEAFTLLQTVKGPIHINAPFDEPLYETVDEFPSVIANKVKQSYEEITSSQVPCNDKIDYDALADEWNTAKKKIILVGVHYPDAELEALLTKVADDTSVLVLTETTSNLRNSKYINSIDNLIFNLTEEEFNELQPDILLTFGGLIVSKKIKKFLRDYAPKAHWHVNELRAFDTYFALTKHLKVDALNFFKEFSPRVISPESDYESKWIGFRDYTRQRHNEYLAIAEYSDLKVFETVLNVLPNNQQVQFSNSAIIRYAQLFQLNPTLSVFCNRGTSGIDGSTSTAIGAAFANKGQTTLVTGDLSFFYDSNALWNTYIPKNFRIIIINNAGGGIFKIIPGPNSTSSLEYFTTPHELTAEHLAAMYGFDYQSVSDLESLQTSLGAFYQTSEQPKILEVFTPSNTNDQVLKAYINHLK